MSILVLQSSWWGRERERESAGCYDLSYWCVVIAVWLFLVVPRICLQFVIVVFPHYTHLLFFLCVFISDMSALLVGSHIRGHASIRTRAVALRGSFFMFVESGCISTNIEFKVP